MSWPWASPEATRKGIQQRLRDRHPADQMQLRLHEVAFRRLLARLEVAAPGRWMVKGGVALLLRLDPNRTSNDIDLSYVRGGLTEALAAFEAALAVDLGDFFRFRLAAPPGEQIVAGDATVPLAVDVLVGERRWFAFGVDLGWSADNPQTDPVRSRHNLTGLAEVDGLPDLTVLAISRQIAQKACALFELHGDPPKFSTRARDLVDLAMIAAQVEGIVATALLADLRSEEALRRASGTLPGPLPGDFSLPAAQMEDWRRRWSRATRGAAMTPDEAYDLVGRFLGPVLAVTASGAWSPRDTRWEVVTASST